ncbi:MAG: hypothetical protein ACYTE5_09510 [Planctomycetota bacterium]|jgi:hypothetical protein
MVHFISSASAGRGVSLPVITTPGMQADVTPSKIDGYDRLSLGKGRDQGKEKQGKQLGYAFKTHINMF